MTTKVYYKVMYQTGVSPEVAIPMSSFSLEQLLPGFTISHVRTENTTLTVTAHAAATSATCPTCGQVAAHVHSHYIRSPRDLPISGYSVQLRLHVRRFRCRNATCPRATFAERLPLVRPWAQQTVRRSSLLRRWLWHSAAKRAHGSLSPYSCTRVPRRSFVLCAAWRHLSHSHRVK
jgi:transposase